MSRTTTGQGSKSKITFERDLVTFMKDVRREEEYLCTGVMIAYMKMEQGAWLEMYLSDISSPDTRSCDYGNVIDAPPSVLLLDNFDSHASEAGQNIVAEETSAIVCLVPANSTSGSTTRTAKQKCRGVVMRTIRAWEDISAECVVKSFEMAIPKEPKVML
ncbi:hypothetical protein PHMEG_00022441 [Phytophthora megakarya]|uniref:DDE-1 domain-containing protein n=1 Tax=Phytophthora megakarya TaxID=4795 RepID=A0A225VKS6_9STRA|nr:hypothetical protein PHMEG_00022441 [Phytophthora megakarya]